MQRLHRYIEDNEVIVTPDPSRKPAPAVSNVVVDKRKLIVRTEPLHSICSTENIHPRVVAVIIHPLDPPLLEGYLNANGDRALWTVVDRRTLSLTIITCDPKSRSVPAEYIHHRSRDVKIPTLLPEAEPCNRKESSLPGMKPLHKEMTVHLTPFE